MSDDLFPVPEFIKGTKGSGWKVERSIDGAHMRPGVLHVPLHGACPMCGQGHALATRSHEVAHGEITLDKHGRMPVLPAGLKNEYFQATEDARIWEHLHRSNERAFGTAFDGEFGDEEYTSPPVLCEFERPKWEAVFKGLDDKMRVLCAVAGGRADKAFIDSIIDNATPPEAAFDAETIKRIRDQAHEMLKEGVSYYGHMTPPIKNTYKVAAFLQKMLEPPAPEEEAPDPDAGSDPADEGKADEREEKGESTEAREETPEEVEEREKEKHDGYLRDKTSTKDGWCEMVMDEPVLGRRLDGRLVSRYTSKDEGSFIRSPHRLYVDGKVFGQKRRIAGGGVLIDDSGSMGLGLEEILGILEHVPGATVGVYSSRSSEGTLRIVARDGKVIDDERLAHTPGGGNGIDGPALRWLASLPFDRKVWISDGQVTGTGDYCSEALELECDIIRKQHNIRMVNPHEVGRERIAEAAAAALQGRQMLAGRGA